MARGIGSKYDLVARDELDTRLATLSIRLDGVGALHERLEFTVGREIGELSRALGERITNLDTATANLLEGITDDQREIFRQLAVINTELIALTWEMRHPWRTRWARVRLFVRRLARRV